MAQRVAALLAQGQVRTPAQEARARRFFAEAFQREAGIAAPRLFTNQERADWVEAYREAEPEARPALLLAARSGAAHSGTAPEGESAPPDAAALAELIAGLPADLRAEAEARAATIAELEEAGIDPAGVDLTQADPDSLYGLRDPRLAEAPQLAQAGTDDAGGAAGAGAAAPFRRREGETTDAWVLRLQDELRAAEGAEARLPIYEAFLQELAEDPAAQAALAQGVGPEAHLSARPAPAHIQADYDAALANGDLRADEGLPGTLDLFYFLGPDGRLYRRGSEQAPSLLPGFSRTVELWMTEDGIGPEEDRGQVLQLLLEELGQSLLTRGRMPPTRRLGIAGGPDAPGGDGPGDGPQEAAGSGAPQGGRRPGGEAGAGLPVGQPDPVLTSRTVVQPVENRQRLLEMAAEAKPGFDGQLEDIAKSIPGTKFDPSRVKEDGPRLTLKIKEFQKEMRDVGVEPDSPDGGANLIRDYLAGRLIPENDNALGSVLARIRKDFEVVDEKDFLREPNPKTGYTALHLQLKHKNGFTVELQVTPPPFKKAADEQREIFEKYRDFGNDIPDALWPEYQRDLARSRAIFDRAWKEWLGAGNADPRAGQ